MEMTMDLAIAYQVIWGLIILNTIGAFITVFRKPRSIASVLAWMMTLVFLPGIGFILYAFCGRGIDGEIVYRFSEDHQNRIAEINDIIEQNNEHFHQTVKTPESELLKRYFRNMEESPVTKGNDVTFYTDGKEKFKGLFEDIRQATDNVHVEYYAFFDDKIGNAFLDILVEKAKEGVEVRVVFDPWGGKTNEKFFRPLIEAGGKVVAFITSRNLIRKTRLNYHLHRKIVVIDGKIGWTGGFNVGDQYLEVTKKFGYWRDTHARIVGTATFTLQEVFIRDWNASIMNPEDALEYEDRYFVVPNRAEAGNVSLQIVADGPESEEQILKGGFTKMLLAAEKRIWIQTPYLIPDDAMINAILVAVRSGVDVRIMIPCMPDHPFIYRATQYYANYFQRRGVKIFNYQGGFIHAKTIVMDDNICSFGTTNQDIRSYALNFEVSAFAYNEELTNQLAQIFEKDMKSSALLTNEMINQQSYWLRFKQNFSRLLSPIL
ncbi:cardiolipin synthase [Enterococcus saccharolyticus]|uniref:Cardiolipin synthase n=1 Tax=Candidatus Enterococcus willemsii TaxID=1857215 RepID=A0ABQ6YWI7_9ENTE|nr:MULTISPECIES: cardiolipin synthase [Enterococcus]KAF1301491.1 cardiolipin synthase [Enterococcus sp. CU12B]MCD5003142.1 cardiolipin synthase [Enterococcus saccharolyticus]